MGLARNETAPVCRDYRLNLTKQMLWIHLTKTHGPHFIILFDFFPCFVTMNLNLTHFICMCDPFQPPFCCAVSKCQWDMFFSTQAPPIPLCALHDLYLPMANASSCHNSTTFSFFLFTAVDTASLSLTSTGSYCFCFCLSYLLTLHHRFGIDLCWPRMPLHSSGDERLGAGRGALTVACLPS